MPSRRPHRVVVLFLVAALVAPAARAMTVDTLVDEQDGSATDGDVSLRDALALAPAGGTIDFSVTGTLKLTRGELKVYRSLTIQGPGRANLTIDGSGNDPTPTTKNGDGQRIVFVNNDAATIKVVIRRLTLKNGDCGNDGGGILSTEDLVVDDCEFSECYAQGSGGGICSRGTRLAVSSSSSFDNFALYGGGSVFAGAGTCVLTDLFAQGNMADKGGAVFAATTVRLTVTRGAFAKNRATGKQSGTGQGGAIFAPSFAFLDKALYFTNSATTAGGAVYAVGYAQIIISECAFNGNTTDGRGGAIASLCDQLAVVANKFNNNRAKTSGGAVYAGGYWSRFAYNSYEQNGAVEGGALTVSGANAYSSYDTYSSNWASAATGAARGGAIYNAGLLRVDAGEFRHNTAVVRNGDAAQGGAIFNAGGVYPTSCLFVENGSGVNCGLKGGAIYAAQIVQDFRSRYEGNTADEGGAIFVGPPASSGGSITVTFERTVMTQNRTASRFGGGISNLAAPRNLVELRDATITGNGPPGSGGGDVYNSGIVYKIAKTVVDELCNVSPGHVETRPQ